MILPQIINNNLSNQEISTSIIFLGLSYAIQLWPFFESTEISSLDTMWPKCYLVQPKFTFIEFSIPLLVTQYTQSNSQFLNKLITSSKISFENSYTTYGLSKVASSIHLTTIILSRPHITTFFTHTHHLSSIPSKCIINDTINFFFILSEQY